MTASAKLEIPDLTRELKSLLRQLPAGRVTTFGSLARALGDVRAARWVAQVLRSSRLESDCPAHRVVMKSGQLGGNDPRKQIQRLAEEGIPLENETVDLSQYGFDDWESTQPLRFLRDHQQHLPAQIELSAYGETPAEIGAVDLSYLEEGTAVACYAVVETETGRLIWSDTVHRPIRFPYITGYLAYREIPILLDLLEQVQTQRRLADVVFVDGNGILHPRRAGIASHLGVLANLCTVGVGKKLLCGQVDLSRVTPDEPQPILDGGEDLGRAMKAEAGSRPVFISPGNRIDSAGAARLARLLFHGHRVPEPIYYADRLSRAEAKSITKRTDKAADQSSPPPQTP